MLQSRWSIGPAMRLVCGQEASADQRLTQTDQGLCGLLVSSLGHFDWGAMLFQQQRKPSASVPIKTDVSVSLQVQKDMSFSSLTEIDMIWQKICCHWIG